MKGKKPQASDVRMFNIPLKTSQTNTEELLF